MSEVQQLGLFDISIYTMEVIDAHDVLESSKIQVTRKDNCVQLDLDLFPRQLTYLCRNQHNKLVA
jgi:hypothetical protein